MKYFLGAILACLVTNAYAIDNGQWNDVEPSVRSWFKSVRSPNGVPCCDIADGHRTEWKRIGQEYWAYFEGDWHPVPPESVIYSAGNPIGEAIVWYVKQAADTYYIRCFVPASEI